jgi:cellulose biosynthesis protein BcsQ
MMNPVTANGFFSFEPIISDGAPHVLGTNYNAPRLAAAPLNSDRSTSKGGPMQQAALVGADTLIVPFMIDFPSMNNTIGFVQLAHTLLPEGARIFLLPIGLPMGKVEGVSQIKPTREEKSYLDTIREQCQCPGRDVVLAEGIPLQKTARKASFKGQTIFEVAPDGAVAQAYDKFCRQVFGL